MTDQEIRELADVLPDNVHGLLKELLSYRALKFLPCWRVWCPDPNPSGWRAVASFPERDDAIAYRYTMQQRCMPGFGQALVLEGHEQPSITAR